MKSRYVMNLFFPIFMILVILNCESATVQIAKGSYPDLVLDQKGKIHLVYVRDGFLYYRNYSVRDEIWSDEQAVGVEVEKVHRSDPEIVMDSKGRPHVMVGAYYAYWNGEEWIVIDPDVVRDTALAIDSKDTVYICRRGGSNGGFLGVRAKGKHEKQFRSLQDPDIGGGFKAGRNDHVYGDIAVNPLDDSIHVVYRHGTPVNCAYRYSVDGGKTWRGGGISDDDREAPSIAISDDGEVFVVTGRGMVYRKTGEPCEWESLGEAVPAGRRDRPQVGCGPDGMLIVTSFGGLFTIWKGEWLGVQKVTEQNDKPVGFMKMVCGQDAIYAVWEKGEEVNNDEIAGTSDLMFTVLPMSKFYNK